MHVRIGYGASVYEFAISTYSSLGRGAETAASATARRNASQWSAGVGTADCIMAIL